MHMPIKNLAIHPDFDPTRWERLCNALAEATQIIQRAHDCPCCDGQYNGMDH